mmetsp:Transcript_9826/g.22480  ORF Transcript_9826/g.22480 Transcript_9826/m.22480 type:complete len:829 (+) Transcript_9826:2263-4749(+)
MERRLGLLQAGVQYAVTKLGQQVPKEALEELRALQADKASLEEKASEASKERKVRLEKAFRCAREWEELRSSTLEIQAELDRRGRPYLKGLPDRPVTAYQMIASAFGGGGGGGDGQIGDDQFAELLNDPTDDEAVRSSRGDDAESLQPDKGGFFDGFGGGAADSSDEEELQDGEKLESRFGGPGTPEGRPASPGPVGAPEHSADLLGPAAAGAAAAAKVGLGWAKAPVTPASPPKAAAPAAAVVCPTFELGSALRLHALTADSLDLACRFGHRNFPVFFAALNGVPAALDEQLVEMANHAALDASKTKPEDYVLPPASSPERFLAYPLLRTVPRETLELRLRIVRHFNVLVAKALPLVDLRQALVPGTLAHSFVRVSGLVWFPIKQELWDRGLKATTTASETHFEVSINRHRSADQMSRRPSDRVVLASTFGQLFNLMNSRPARDLRISPGSSRGPFKVNFVGEGSIDAGGPYRECLSDAVGELHMPHLGLFVPCANRKAEAEGFVAGMAGIHNMDKYVPNPNKRRPLHLQLYGFVGKLLGLALRSGAALPFHFPPLVYKRLLGQPVGRTDLKLIDKFLVEQLDKIAQAPADPQAADPEMFEYLYGDRTFTTKSVDGREVELKPGGRRVPLTLENCREFVRLMFAYHLAEFDVQVAAMARGLATQVPLQVLRVFNASQFELLVTGRAEVDLELLKSKTSYDHPYSPSHPTIVLFWQMMEAFTHVERQMMIKFAWSRDRLPLRAEDFSSNFKITRLSCRQPNEAMPQSHTCFFTIDLPEYTSLEAMSHKVRYAIENCTAIDNDGNAGDFGTGEDNAGDESDEESSDDEY